MEITKTCLVTTAWIDNEHYYKKTEKFINYYKQHFNDIYIIDNGSVGQHTLPKGATILTQYPHYARESHLDYKYWWRAIYSLKYFLDMGYDKVVYADNDFFVISPEMLDWVNRVTGWATPYCNRHNFPETQFQVVTKCSAYLDYVADKQFWKHDGQVAELIMPFTTIRKDLIGDRYGELGITEQAVGWDFCGQTPLEVEIRWGV